MNNTVKIGLIGLGGIALGFAIAKSLSNQKNKGQERTKKKPKEEVKKEQKQAPTIVSADDFPLKLGSQGNKVKRLQVFLMRKLGVIRKPTGEFDQITLKRVQKWFKAESVSRETYKGLMLDRMVHDQRKRRTNGRPKK